MLQSYWVSSRDASSRRLLIKVRGTVQGVGFRPYVYGLASACGLAGFVANTAEGVTIEVEGEAAREFLARLTAEAPPLARIASVEVAEAPLRGYPGFSILESEDAGGFTLISPDVATCPDCLRELYDPSDRRYLYPFINCTNCGPRYTITRRTPYDRANTTMAPFAMCPECEAEYRDPSNRRFHAEPNACPACGPRVALMVKGGGRWAPDASGEPAMERAVALLKDGAVVAIKGLGGFHLACDAENPEAVERLRRAKRRSMKPFALMAPHAEAVRAFCRVSPAEEGLLLSARRPIVLMERIDPCPLPEAVSPATRRLGFMLPYTPLHHLLFKGREEWGLRALVMTSGNVAEEPIQVQNGEALSAIGTMAEAFVLHDRDIFMRADDSVAKAAPSQREAPGGSGTFAGGEIFIRRSRGYAPEPVPLKEDGPDVLAAGADIKNTFTLMKGAFAIVSQHIGDMENFETLNFFEEALENLKAVYRARPVALAHDLHAGYLSTAWALRQPLPRLGVQHHHAHVASVMAEHGLGGKVVGVALDGTGYGPDGSVWGGEFLVADALGFERAAHLKYIRLPGGEAAVREPWRTAVSMVSAALGGEAPGALRELGFYERHGAAVVENVLKIGGMREVSPLSSGAGRLFDAVSAVLGICDRNTFEGEAAMALEAEAAEGEEGGYPYEAVGGRPVEVDFSRTLRSIIGDVKAGVERGVIAARFHNTVARAVCEVAGAIARKEGLRDVALSGGVFQNDYLLRRVAAGLEAEGLQPRFNALVPPNDGGVSLGQAFVLRAALKAGRLKA